MKNEFIKLIMITIAVTCTGLSAHALPPDKAFRSCKKDNDCVVVDGAFCECAVSGVQEQYGVNKKYEAKVKKKYQSERETTAAGCPAGYSDEDAKKCANLRAVCLARLCEVR